MANPSIVECPANVWTKVATDVLIGNVWILKPETRYYHTYRLTGGAEPEGVTEQVQIDGDGIPINHSVGIDVYIYCSDKAGEVRVDV